MVNFAFGEDQELLRSTVRRFLEDRGALGTLRASLEGEDDFDADLWRRGADLGWTAMLIPEPHGGGSISGQPLVDLAALAEELGRVLYPGPFLPTNVVADAVARSGSEALQQSLLPALATGTATASWCATGDGTMDPAAVAVAATRTPDGLRLDGLARFVHGAQYATHLLVAARFGSEPVATIVTTGTPGIAVRPVVGLDLSRRFAEVGFDGVVVPDGAILADGAEVAERAWKLATVIKAAEDVGAADHLVEETVRYAKDRVQFGRAIGSFQAIKHRLADLLVILEAMRAAARYAALALGDGADDSDEAVAVAGSFVSDAFSRICGEALQIHGGIGFTWEHDVHLFVRRSKVDQVLYGEPWWHRAHLCDLVERTMEEAG